MSRAGPDSNIVRASVLEAALELGVAHNSTVANWIFNSPLTEESEELDDTPPEPEPAEEVRCHYLPYDVILNVSIHYTPADIDACPYFRLKYHQR